MSASTVKNFIALSHFRDPMQQRLGENLLASVDPLPRELHTLESPACGGKSNRLCLDELPHGVEDVRIGIGIFAQPLQSRYRDYILRTSTAGA